MKKKPFGLEFLEILDDAEIAETNGGVGNAVSSAAGNPTSHAARHEHNPHMKVYTKMASYVDPQTGKLVGDY